MKTIIREYGETIITGVIVVAILAVILGLSIGSKTGFFAATGSLASASSNEMAEVESSVVSESISDTEVEVVLNMVPRVNAEVSYADLFTVTDAGEPVDYHIVSIDNMRDLQATLGEDVVCYDGETLCFFRRGTYQITIEVYGKTRSIHQLEMVVI